MDNYKLASVQLILLQAAVNLEIKEYKEEWRNSPVMRQGGRFASKVSTASNKIKERAEQIAASTMTAVNKRVDIIRESLSKLDNSIQLKLIEAFQSPPMNKARSEIGANLGKVSPESKEIFDEINSTINLSLKKGQPLDEALSSGQKKAMNSLEKAISSMKDAAKEHKAGLLAMGACAALTSVAGGAGLLIGAGLVGAVSNWSVPNLLGNAVEFATTKQLLKDDKDLLGVWQAELDAEISQFLFRASLVVAGIGVLILAEEITFHALESDKKVFAQGIKVATQDAIAGIADNPGFASSQDDTSKLSEYYRESRDKRLETAQELTQQVTERASEFATEAAQQAKDVASKVAQQAVEDAQQAAKDNISKTGEQLKKDALNLIPGQAERGRATNEKKRKEEEATENEVYRQIADSLIKQYPSGKEMSPERIEELQRIHLEHEKLSEERRLEHERVRQHLKELAEARERKLKRSR
jgi:hypothetical protein